MLTYDFDIILKNKFKKMRLYFLIYYKLTIFNNYETFNETLNP